MDRRPDGKLEVIDYKAGKTLDSRQLKRELQAKIYTLMAQRMWKDNFGQITFHYLNTDSKVTVDFTREELKQTLDTIKDVGKAIYDNKFEPKPGSICSWCDYQKICPEWKDRPSSKDKFRLSYSKMSSFKNCQRSYKFLYVDHVPPQPKSFFSVGIAAHNSLEEFYQYDGYLKEPPLKLLLKYLDKNWSSAGFVARRRKEIL